MQEFKSKFDIPERTRENTPNQKPKKNYKNTLKRVFCIILSIVMITGICFNTNLINAIAGTATVTLYIGNNGRFDVEYTNASGQVIKATYEGTNTYYNYDYKTVSLSVKTGTTFTVYMVPDGHPGGNGDWNTKTSTSTVYLESNANRGYTILDLYRNDTPLNKYDYGASTVGVINNLGEKISEATHTAKISETINSNVSYRCTYTKIYNIEDWIKVPVWNTDSNGYIDTYAYCVDDHYIDYSGCDIGYYFMTANVCGDSNAYDGNVSALGSPYPCIDASSHGNDQYIYGYKSNKKKMCITGSAFVTSYELNNNFYTSVSSSTDLAKALYGLNDAYVNNYPNDEASLRSSGKEISDENGTSGFQTSWPNVHPGQWGYYGQYFALQSIWSCSDIKRYSSLMEKFRLNKQTYTSSYPGNGTVVRDIFYYDAENDTIGDSFWVPAVGAFPDENGNSSFGYKLQCGANRSYIKKYHYGYNTTAVTSQYGWTFALPNGIYPVNTFTAKVANTDEVLFTAQFDNIKSCITPRYDNATDNYTYYVKSQNKTMKPYTEYTLQIRKPSGYEDPDYNVNNWIYHPVLANDVLPGYKIKGFKLDYNDKSMSYANTKIKINTNGTISSFMMNWFGSNITYRYEVVPYLATLDKRGGTGGTDGPVKFIGGKTLSSYSGSKSVQAPQKEGYTFAGYYDALDSSGNPTGNQWYDATGKCTNITTPKKNVTLYAKWTPNIYTVTYDKDDNLATLKLASGYKAVESVACGAYADTRTTTHYGSKLGWNFMGWGTIPNPTPEKILASGTNVYKMPASNITLFAGYKRTFTLKFAADTLTNTPAKDYTKTIYNDETAFVFNNLSETTKKTDANYTITLVPNGGTLISKGSTDSSSDIINNKIISTTSFKGWYTANTGGNQVGTSDTSITVVPSTTDATKYTLKGNISGGTTITSTNNSTTLYPRWNEAYIILPDATRNTDKDGGNGTAADKFLGWFTKPQPVSGSGNGGTYIGKPGDKIKVTGDMTLYAWYNIAPTLTEGELSNTFFEGQSIDYKQLLSLVNGKDKDDPIYSGEVEWIGARAWVDKYKEEARRLLDETYTSDTSVLQPIETIVNGVKVTIENPLKDTYMSEETKDKIINGINYDNFKPEITSITYKRNGKDKNNQPFTTESEFTQDQSSIETNGLLTETKNIGDIVINYSITDNGIMNDGHLIDNSKITVNFALNCKIKFNSIPKLILTSGYIFADDDSVNANTIEQIIINKQTPFDTEDNTDNRPWWDKTDTTTALRNSVYIVGVYDIMMESAYEYDNPEKASEIKRITDIKSLFRLKETDKEAFNSITNFKVELDCHDQWSKKASEAQSRLSRSVDIINVNNHSDEGLIQTSISESLRYINAQYISSLSEDTYWGSYGKEYLKEIFNRYTNKDSINKETYTGEISNPTVNDIDRKIKITVNDYTNS